MMCAPVEPLYSPSTPRNQRPGRVAEKGVGGERCASGSGLQEGAAQHGKQAAGGSGGAPGSPPALSGLGSSTQNTHSGWPTRAAPDRPQPAATAPRAYSANGTCAHGGGWQREFEAEPSELGAVAAAAAAAKASTGVRTRLAAHLHVARDAQRRAPGRVRLFVADGHRQRGVLEEGRQREGHILARRVARGALGAAAQARQRLAVGDVACGNSK